MKLKLLLLSAIIGFSTTSFAQADSSAIQTNQTVIYTPAETHYAPKSEYRFLRMGINTQAGLGWIKSDKDGYNSEGSRFTYEYGLLIDINFTRNYTLSTGAYMASMGGKLSYLTQENIKGVSTVGTMNRTYKNTFIEIPSLLKLKTNQMGYFTYFAELGFLHDFKIQAKADDKFTYNDAGVERSQINNNVNINKSISDYQIAFDIALGAEYAVSQTFSVYAKIGFDNWLTDGLSGTNQYYKGINEPQKEQGRFKKLGLTVGVMF